MMWWGPAVLAMQEAVIQRLLRVLDCGSVAKQVHFSVELLRSARTAHSSHRRMRSGRPVAIVL